VCHKDAMNPPPDPMTKQPCKSVLMTCWGHKHALNVSGYTKERCGEALFNQGASGKATRQQLQRCPYDPDGCRHFHPACVNREDATLADRMLTSSANKCVEHVCFFLSALTRCCLYAAQRHGAQSAQS
jgi:hypothetical protein